MPYSNRDLTAEQWAILTAPDNPDFPADDWDDAMELQDVDAWEAYEYDDLLECGCCSCCGCDCDYWDGIEVDNEYIDPVDTEDSGDVYAV